MPSRIQAKNVFVTRIKDNTIYESITELDFSESEDQDISKDEIIQLNGLK
jgi:hypothetical protein